MESLKKTELIASGGLLLATIIWGFAFVVVKNSLDLIPPVYMVAIRFTIAFLAMSIIFAKKYKLLDKKTFKRGAVLGFWLFFSYRLWFINRRFIRLLYFLLNIYRNFNDPHFFTFSTFLWLVSH